MLVALSLAVAVLLTAALADGCERTRLVRPRGNSSLSEAHGFAGFPLYFAGRSTGRYRLEAAIRTDRTSPARYTEFAFLYGACRLPEGEGGCSSPLQILLWPACYRYEQR